ncbi:MAG: sigma-54 dependent transcriptional regulator [candidate division Zixibacteria bacterium]|nr:sigma-54 dependent transcriptional regulator [candidate division Zixibacteria bacterium]
MSKGHLLIVDDEAPQREMLAGFLKKEGYSVTVCDRPSEGIKAAEGKLFDLGILDLRMPQMSGIELLVKLKELNPEMQVIVITAFGTVETAVDALKKGAFHYLTKPVSLEELKVTLQKAREGQLLLAENKFLKETLEVSYKDELILGKSEKIKEVLSLVARVAKSNSTVLILGESGTGKELVARAIHRLSARAQKPFVALNSAALPETLLESELFGFEKGAFTGAVKSKPGKFEMASGGTFFLDEIGDLPLPLQAKLLRVLETQEIERLGATGTVKIDVRFLAATHQNLEEKVKTKTFREDLYYRLNVVSITIPPLRERREDIAVLAEHFIHKFSSQMGKPSPSLTREAFEAMLNYGWPGNVRELENALERAALLARGEQIDVEDLKLKAESSPSEAFPLPSGDSLEPLEVIEKQHIRKVLESVGWNFSRAAEILGIHRNTLRLKIREYGISEALNE